MTSRRRWLVGLGATAGVLALYCCVIEPFVLPEFIPIRRSPARIQAELLKETPIGSSRADVQAVVDSHRWGFGMSGGYEPPGSLTVSLGHCWFVYVFFDANVFATWVFDENDRLKDVQVRRNVYMEGLP